MSVALNAIFVAALVRTGTGPTSNLRSAHPHLLMPRRLESRWAPLPESATAVARDPRCPSAGSRIRHAAMRATSRAARTTHMKRNVSQRVSLSQSEETMTYTSVAARRAVRRVALASIAAAAIAPGVAHAGGYSVAVFHGNSFRSTSLGMTGDGINARGDIVGESPVIVQVSGQLLGSNHGVEVKAGGAFVDLPDLDRDANA